MEDIYIETTMLQIVCQAEHNRAMNDASIALLKARIYSDSNAPEKSIDKTYKWLESSLSEGSEKLGQLLKDIRDIISLEKYDELETQVSKILYDV